MERMPDYYRSISLAAKAGKVVSGGMMTEKTIQSQKAYLVLIADDASENTKKSFLDHCHYYKLPVVTVQDRETLGRLIGKESRSSAAVTDENLSALILKQYEKKKSFETSEE